MKIFRQCLFVALLVIASVWGVSVQCAFAGSDSAVIFMYHRFGDSRYPSTNIRMDQFKAQVAYLEAGGFTVAPLGDVVLALKEGRPLKDKTVVLTMDDAYASVYQNAWPLLKEKGWPFTVFVNTDSTDKRLRDYMTWDQMREMKSQGVVFGNHTATHDHLPRRVGDESREAWLARVKANVVKGQQRLQAELGECPLFLAYPYGEYNVGVADLVSELGYVAFGQQSGAVGPYTDFKAAPRFPISEAYGELGAFKTKANARALPVSAMTPRETHTFDTKPVLDIELAPSDALLNELSCYVSGQGRVPVTWTVSGKRFTVQAVEPLAPGRHKYNITIPDKSRRRYYWFSRQWVVKKPLVKRPQKEPVAL